MKNADKKITAKFVTNGDKLKLRCQGYEQGQNVPLITLSRSHEAHKGNKDIHTGKGKL